MRDDLICFASDIHLQNLDCGIIVPKGGMA